MSIPTIVARPAHRAIQYGAITGSLLSSGAGFWPCSATLGSNVTRSLSSPLSRVRDGLQLSSESSSHSLKTRSLLEHIRLSRRSISSTSHLRRKWMERQPKSTTAQSIQQPVGQNQYYQRAQYIPTDAAAEATLQRDQNIVQRAMLTTYGLIGLLVAVWSAHNYSDGGTLLPNGIPLPKPPGWDAVKDLLGVQMSKPPISRGLQTPTSIALEIKTNFASEKLSYRTSDYPPATWDVKHLSPFVTSTFAHFSPLHLAFSCYFTWSIMPIMITRFGIPRALAAFMLGGSVASIGQCEADKAYALNQAPGLFKHIKQAQRDPDPMGTLGVLHVGSTGALFVVGTVATLGFKTRNFRIFSMAMLAFDMVGYYMDLDTGVSYTTHLAGIATGAVMYFGWLRWTKAARGARAFI